jgi:UDPglucose 6-dehydrogenase
MFFTNGCAVEDFNWPDRIILGTPSSEAVSTLKQIFHPLVMRGVPVLVTNYETAELAREATTAFVATKISFINEIASLCEHVNADAVSLSLALGLDKKIAPRCLQPGAGMGGIFAESDMESITGLARENHVDLKVLNAAREVNMKLADRLLQKVAAALDTVQNKDVGILGWRSSRTPTRWRDRLPATGAEPAGRGSARAGLRSSGDSRCAPATERHGEILRIRLRSLAKEWMP